MGQWIPLATASGPIRAWQELPHVPARGGLVVVQEIFGVNAHIRAVCAGYAAHGYAVLAPAFFDHVEPGVELDYDADGIARGRALVDRLGLPRALEDVAAAARQLEEVGGVAVIGYCWGGTVAFLANTRLGLPAISYYGARTAPFLHEPATAPLQFHFGEHDASIPPEVVAEHRRLQPQAELYVYPAGHGFNCDRRADYEPGSAALARERSLAFLQRVLRPAG
jgi:carboxymethylenebutenolidase